MLRGQFVSLRPVQRGDITSHLKWFNDTEVTKYLDIHFPMTEMIVTKEIEALGMSKEPTYIPYIIENIDGQKNLPIGRVDLYDLNHKDHNASFRIIIGEKQYWNKGYGTEAARLIINYGFEQLNLYRISSSVISFNERSLKLHLKVGFREEGKRLQAVYKNGAYHDEVIFGLLRDECTKLKNI